MLMDYPQLIIQKAKPDVVVSEDPMPLLPQLAIRHTSRGSLKTKPSLNTVYMVYLVVAIRLFFNAGFVCLNNR